MRNAECTPLTQDSATAASSSRAELNRAQPLDGAVARSEEEKALFAAFPRYLSDGDEALARKFFPQYVFFHAVEKNTRHCVCTSCMEGFTVDREIRPDFFRIKHKGVCECPNCGQRAKLLAMGKYKNFDSLGSHERAVKISAWKGWLLVQAGYVFRSFDGEDLGGDIRFEPFRMYAFAPGRRVGWQAKTYSWFGKAWWTDGMWERMDRIKSPFQARAYETEVAYWPMGVENIEKSSLRYCQYAEWFDAEYGCLLCDLEWVEAPFRIAHLIRYLAEYTRRPQMEFLVKLGFHQVVSDLVLRGKPHGDILDWKAGNPADFFRLSKADFRLFKDIRCDFEELKGYRSLRRKGLVSNLAEFVRLSKDWGRDFCLVRTGAGLAHVNLERAVRYLRQVGGKPAVTAQIWVDYLEAAGKLKYDLSRDDVRMPKDLAQRHDLAAASLRTAEDEKARKRYQGRYRRLTEQFSFSAGGLRVAVPESVQDIVREGRVLQHCVGGYAERHVKGAVTILFLRKESAPNVPYVTVEMSVENNCRELRIRQIHGYRNERDGGRPPEQVHAGFLEMWLAWVHEGSPRDPEGRPVVPQAKEITAA